MSGTELNVFWVSSHLIPMIAPQWNLSPIDFLIRKTFSVSCPVPGSGQDVEVDVFISKAESPGETIFVRFPFLHPLLSLSRCHHFPPQCAASW